MFAHVDTDESGHLTHDELYHLLGVPKTESRAQLRCERERESDRETQRDRETEKRPTPLSCCSPEPSGACCRWRDREDPEHAGVFKMMDGLVDGMKASLDADGDGAVTRAEFHALLHGEL